MGKICLGRLNIRKSPSNFLISTWYHSCFVANRASTIHRRNFLQQNLATSFLRTQGSINPSRMQRSANKFKVEKCLGFFWRVGHAFKTLDIKKRSEVRFLTGNPSHDTLKHQKFTEILRSNAAPAVNRLFLRLLMTGVLRPLRVNCQLSERSTKRLQPTHQG